MVPPGADGQEQSDHRKATGSIRPESARPSTSPGPSQPSLVGPGERFESLMDLLIDLFDHTHFL